MLKRPSTPKAHLQDAGYWHVLFSSVDAISGNISLQDSTIELKDKKKHKTPIAGEILDKEKINTV